MFRTHQGRLPQELVTGPDHLLVDAVEQLGGEEVQIVLERLQVITWVLSAQLLFRASGAGCCAGWPARESGRSRR